MLVSIVAESKVLSSGETKMFMKMIARVFYPVLCVLTVIFGILAPKMIQGASVEAAFDLAAGYNDNVTRTRDATGSAFSASRIALDVPFLPGLDALDGNVLGSAAYQHYMRAGDNYQFQVGVALDGVLYGGRILPRLMAAATAFRDHAVPQDEMNEYSLDARIDWLAGARSTVWLHQVLARQNYRQPVPARHGGRQDSGRTCSTAAAGQGSIYGPSRKNCDRFISRRDWFWKTRVGFSAFPAPDVALHLILAHQRITSTVGLETRYENGLGLTADWQPADAWQISAQVDWKATNYTQTHHRSDTLRIASLSLSRFMAQTEIYFKIEWLDNPSSLPVQTWRRTITQCGISYFF